MTDLPQVFTREVTINKFDADSFIAFIDACIDVERVLHSQNINEDENPAIYHLKRVRSEAVKLLKI